MDLAPGVYTVTLKVRNNFGEDTKVRSSLIQVNKSPAVDFVADMTTVGVGRRVTFTDLSLITPTNWVWDFGDGSTGTGARPDHVYRTTGVYDVTLTASNADMTTSRTRNQYITVLNIPRADFTADKTRGGAPLNVNFADKSTGAPDSWQWDFGDGANSTEQNPVHQYNTPGKFSVTLNVSNANGQDSTVKADFIITTPAPVADFRADRQSGNAPFVVRFTDLSKGSPDTWSWDFGDGTGSEEQNPSHIYMNEGTYDVRLTVSNQHGSDSVSLKDTSSARATTTPSGTPAAAMTSSPLAEVTLTSASPAPAATKSPLSMGIAVFALLAGLLLIAAGKRR